jgi:ABC-type glycerol-3-phosphate transport system substrate-binding protein
MDKLRPFQIGLLAAFAILAIVSLIIISTYQGIVGGQVNPYGEQVIIWGTLDETAVLATIQDIIKVDKNYAVVDYFQKDARTFETELVNAIAENNGPDAIILSHEDLVTLRNKLLPIPYDTIPARTFRDTYIDGAEIFARNDGIYALPIAVDPLLMYWNRDLFASGGIPLPPSTWENLTQVVQQLTLRDATRNILQSTVAFGEYRNIQHGKEVLLMLLIQSGSRLVEENEDKYVVALDTPVVNDARKPFNATLQFFVDFSNSNSPLYSWNRSISDDLTSFLAEDLALYFGNGSEYQKIRELNPNFNFDTAPVPQGAGATILRNYGTFYGLALIKSSDNPQGTYQAIVKLAAPEPMGGLTEKLSLAPVLRNLVAAGATDPFRQTIFNQALIARAWLDPNKAESNTIFQEMVEDVVSNRQKVSGAVSDALRKLELAF